MENVCQFFRDERGAVTVDWVALTAGILILGIAVVYAIFDQGATPAVAGVNDTLDKAGADTIIGPTPDFSGG